MPRRGFVGGDVTGNGHRVGRVGLVTLAQAAGVVGDAFGVEDIDLVAGLVQGREGQNASQLLVTGGAIWLTNMIVFSLWYWELDRGGPVARANATMVYPDFLFAQMQSPDLAPRDWEPAAGWAPGAERPARIRHSGAGDRRNAGIGPCPGWTCLRR